MSGNDTNGQSGQLSWSNPQNGQQGQKSEQKPAQPQPSASQQPRTQKAAPAAKSAAPATPASAPMADRSAAKVVGWLAVGVVAGVVIAWGATKGLNHNATTTASGNESATSTGGANATSSLLRIASPQKAGTAVAVGGVSVSAPTWVVVYESREGKPGNVLGASLFFPGASTGTVELLRGTVAGQTYFVTERKDNGDRRFSMSADSLVLGADGQPSWATFTAN